MIGRTVRPMDMASLSLRQILTPADSLRKGEVCLPDFFSMYVQLIFLVSSLVNLHVCLQVEFTLCYTRTLGGCLAACDRKHVAHVHVAYPEFD